jgi:uncharacterized protein (DUF433 family)
MSAISIGCGQCTKAWFAWPPTQHNENTFYPQSSAAEGMSKNGETFQFATIAPRLQGGQLVIAGPRDAVYLPAGWIHSVLTLEGSYLIGLTFTCLSQLDTLLRCFRLEAQSCQSTTDQKHTLIMIAATLDLALQSLHLADIYEALRVYLGLIDVLNQGISERGLDWGRPVINKLTKVIVSYTNRATATFPESCPCGKQSPDGATHFRAHFPSEHTL